ncbi:wall-associated receptor kinase-like 2 [Cucurbita maxima]|uniref:Wall-associated receptor kinase-like 2 n=1 Tax=Cucurbita maxima TaxID=3661 RepID=A0A6J1JD61_CUCMA|nr:wall-associated receptor kinase-like 2 [Cucurbita maxima]
MEASFASYCCLCFILFLSLFPIQSVSKYPYLGTANQTSGCSINDTNSTPNGYYSCAYVPYSSCSSYLIAKSKSHNQDLGFYDKSIGNTNLLMKAVGCSCGGDHLYGNIMEYNTTSGDSYETIANHVFYGFTSCSMLRSFNPNHSIDINASSTEGISVEVWLRCACPTQDQKNLGIQSLAVYMVQPNESISSIARDLLVEQDSILEANMLSNTTQLYPFTPLLVPLNTSETCKIDPSNSDACVSRYLKSYLKFVAIAAIISITFAIGIGMFCCGCGCVGQRLFIKRRSRKLCKKKFFRQNGGLLLQQKVQEDNERVKIFLQEELEEATHSYSQTRFLGQGGFGTVYKGILHDNTVVAVKRSKRIEEAWIEQFINEVVILSRINHKNIVRLIGCCLEAEYPLLVYEFVSNGTLSSHLHHTDHGESSSLSWETRLGIASEVAGAISYMHSAASTPIFHRDIKSLNILLDNNYSAKVSEFGTSRFVSCDQSHLTTRVHGTLGYIDPEYFRSSQYTEKSDVYSFGVVMVELLTGKHPTIFARNEERNLLEDFIALENGKEVVGIVDSAIAKDEETMEGVNLVAKLTAKCLRANGKESPTMKQVYLQLEGLRKAQAQRCSTSNSFCSMAPSDEDLPR